MGNIKFMENNPLVSIIIPTYNVETYISETIECVLNQTFNDWELVITDDCSTDTTVDIIKKYINTDSRIRLSVLPNNSGAAKARNNSIEKAKGRYIAFLDSDDWWFPTKLEKQISFMQNNNYEFCFTAFEYADKDLNVIGVSHKPGKITYKGILLGNNIGTPGAIYDTLRIGKMYMPNMRISEDWGLWIKIIEKTGAAYSINEALWKYRILPNTLSRNKFRLIKHNLYVYNKVLHFSKLKSLLLFIFGFTPMHIYKMLYNKIDSFFYLRKHVK